MSDMEHQPERGLQIFRAALARLESKNSFITDIGQPQIAFATTAASSEPVTEQKAVEQLAEDTANRVAWDSFHRKKRRHQYA